MSNEETPICSKCGKTGNDKQPFIDLDGKKFCCDVCCGDEKSGRAGSGLQAGKEDKKKPAICEFC